MIDFQILQDRTLDYRAETYHLARRLWLQNEKDAIRFVEERGFVFFWPIKNAELPSLWNATVGDRPLPNTHDDPGHITWRWKDDLLDKHVWYYAKLIRKKSTIVSLTLAPHFYALTPNYGDFENDYLVQYKNGLMSRETKNVYEALLHNGPTHTIDLRKAAHLSSTENKYRFDKALTDLQAEMKIVPVGIANVGRWGYAMIYDIAARCYPEIVEAARFLSEEKAQQTILLAYLRSVGMAESNRTASLFGWKSDFLMRAAQYLAGQDHITIFPDLQDSKTYLLYKSIFPLQ
ncbi:MAG TPA: hypothetical protein DCK95_04860 [Anaerolineaceae bacterium]|nr:hypothetical protein [Anaerolineaceae bacterium]